jgi:hypothetical protein
MKAAAAAAKADDLVVRFHTDQLNFFLLRKNARNRPCVDQKSTTAVPAA